MVLLVFANGFFVATEFALVSVRRTRMQQLATEGNRRARSVLDRLDHLDTYIAATQLGITISSLALGWLGEPALARLIEPVVHHLPFIPASALNAATHTISFAIAFSIVTALHIVLGELAPKSMALQRPDETSMLAAGPIHGFYIVFRPAIALLNGIGNAVVRTFGIEPAAGHTLVQSAEELRLSIDASREAGLVGQAASVLVDRAFTFTDLEVRQVMVPRTEVEMVPVDATLDEVIRIAAESSHTRLPVYERDNDHIVGVLNVKRLLPLLYQRLTYTVTREPNGQYPSPNGASANGTTSNGTSVLAAGDTTFDIRDHMMAPFAVPETAQAAEVLAQLREARYQFAIVIDEYGGTAGIVTLEDLVERLVGEIQEEGEPADEPVVAADGTMILDGLTTIVEAREEYDLDLDGDEYGVETVGGYVFAALGRPARIGDEVTLPNTGQVLRVEELDRLRVAKVRVLPSGGPVPMLAAGPAHSAMQSEVTVHTAAD